MAETDPNCIFCKIVTGELPATIVAEDERTLAFMDINPATRGHALVIPRAHTLDLHTIEAEDLQACVLAARRLAGRAVERLHADGANVLNAAGSAAGLPPAAPPLNLFDDAMIAGVRDAIDDVAAHHPRGLLIRAEGRVVSGGVNVNLFDGLTPQDAGRLWTDLLAMIHTVEELPFPTVFAAHRLCLTAAFAPSPACDLLVA